MAMWLLEQFAFYFSGTLVKEMTSITIVSDNAIQD
jgi:hypothetical protein